MAIQPIDLQTLFTQVDKVGKREAVQKEGVQLQQSLQNVQIQKRTEERSHSVNETRDTGQGAERVKDRESRKWTGQEGKDDEEKDGSGSSGEDENSPVIRDPDLGRNIDVSG